MAFAITDGRREFTPVNEYYRMFPQEITKSATVNVGSPVVSIEPRTFQGLVYSLNTYAFQRNDKDVVLVVHGHTDTKRGPDGLGIPLNELTSMLATEDAFNDLERMLNDRLNYSRIGTAAETKFQGYTTQTAQGRQVPVQMRAGTLEQVFNVLVTIRYRELNRVEIRACNLGLNKTVLTTLGRLLGTKFISAPNTHMFYVQVDPGRTMTAPGFKKWVRSRPGSRVFQNNSNPGDSLCLRVQGTGPFRTTECATTSTNLGWFFQQFVMKKAVFSGLTRFMIAGMDHNSSSKPFVLPQEPEYRGHLVEVGPLPSLEPWMKGQD